MDVINHLTHFGHQIKVSLIHFRDDGCIMLAAGISYFALISLAPIFVVALRVATIFIGYQEGETRLITQLSAIIGRRGATALRSMIRSAQLDQLSTVMTVLGILLLLFVATTLFAKLADSLNRIFKIAREHQRNSFIRVLRKRLLSLTMIVGIGFLLLVSIIFETLVVSTFDYVKDLLGLRLVFFLAFLQFILSTTLQAVLFGIVLKVMPEKRISWGDSLSGGALTAVLFAFTKFFFGLFFGNQNIASSYGAAGAVVVILVWVFLTAVVFFIGAEYTATLVRERERRIGPIRKPV